MIILTGFQVWSTLIKYNLAGMRQHTGIKPNWKDYHYADNYYWKAALQGIAWIIRAFCLESWAEGMKNMTFIPITDHTFRDLSDIRHLCPCGLDIKTCKREDTGEVFKVGRILTGTAKGTCLYPAGNEFAKMTCEVVFKWTYQRKDGNIMLESERKAMIKMLLQAYRETGNKRFLARALKLARI
jgi:hypothetical protein